MVHGAWCMANRDFRFPSSHVIVFMYSGEWLMVYNIILGTYRISIYTTHHAMYVNEGLCILRQAHTRMTHKIHDAVWYTLVYLHSVTQILLVDLCQCFFLLVVLKPAEPASRRQAESERDPIVA